MHLPVNGSSTTVELSIEGVVVSSSTCASLSTAGVSAIQVGNDTSAQAPALVAGDVEVK